VSFRVRVTLAAGAAVLVVVAAVSTAVYVLVRQDLRDQIDDSLQTNRVPREIAVNAPFTESIQRRSGAPFVDQLVEDRYLQLVDADGDVVVSHAERGLPVTDEVVDIAQGEEDEWFYDSSVDGTPVRVYAVSVVDQAGERYAIQFGRSLVEVNDSLRQLVVVLAGVSVVGVGIAVVLGRLVSAAVVSPVQRLSHAAETIARTGDLSHHIDVAGRDELSRLAGSFNTMLDALESSLAQQRHLVADASHELRTPLASVRTNVEVLQRATGLDPVEREQLLADVVAQIGELTRLVEDLVELARGEDREEPFESFELALLVAEVIQRAHRNHPAVEFQMMTNSSRSTVRGTPRRVDRAITNLVDNAAKWSPAGGRVRVDVVGGAVAVSDQGPGIDPVDIPHVFDRFYRSARARSMPGSGLGLAIVRQVADSHGGSVAVGPTSQGGARFVLRLPPD